MNMDLTSFYRMHGLVEDLRRKCVIEYWEQRNADDPLAQFGPYAESFERHSTERTLFAP